jgi:acetolactate synthase-1/2/3 large subunit
MSTAAQLIVKCLENEGVSIVFGIPGEENIRLIQALAASDIRYVLTRHEQAAAFMAEMYGRVTGRAGVVSATLGRDHQQHPGRRHLGAGRSGPRIQGVPPIR